MKMLWLASFATAIVSAQNQPMLGEDAVRVSEHVWTIMGWPNVGIVVGSRATLIVDTGLGPRNGAAAARVASGLAPGNRKLFLTTTHFHPEHASGVAGFPDGTVLIRDAVQQREMDAHGQEMIDLFASRSPQFKDLLENATLRKPDITFDTEAQIDLGGVNARLLWFGGAHKVVPGIFREGGTPSSWLAVLDKVAALNPAHVLPDHSAPGDGSMVAHEKEFITDLRNSALALKRTGMSAEDAGKRLQIEFKAKYPAWPSMNVSGFVRSIYAE